jgi:hypothetical protein
MLDPLFPATRVEEIIAYFRSQSPIGPDGRSTALENLPAGIAMAAYSLGTIIACPGLMAAINGPRILGIVSRYLGCKPTISSLGVRWSFPTAARPAETQLFHRDPDDWRFLKLFVYLTEVDLDSGPHVYVAGSNRTQGHIRARPYSRSELEARFGPESIQAVTGPRGTTFLADTHGIHMGKPPQGRARLMLQVQYSLLPIFAFRYEPVTGVAGLDLDPYVNRLILR